MEHNLMEKSLNEDTYRDYIEKIINVFRLSKKESSIFFSLKINQDKANINLSIIDSQGEKEEFQDVVLKCDRAFYDNFLKQLVIEIEKNISIVSKDIVNLDQDSLVAFRMIAENNDIFTFDGLSEEDAKYLLKVSNESKILSIDNTGFASIGMFFLMISVLIVTFIATVHFVG